MSYTDNNGIDGSFPAETEDGKIVQIVKKSYDEPGVRGELVLIDSEGNTYRPQGGAGGPLVKLDEEADKVDLTDDPEAPMVNTGWPPIDAAAAEAHGVEVVEDGDAVRLEPVEDDSDDS